MIGSKRKSEEVSLEVRLSPLDRLVVNATGDTETSKPFEYIVRVATIEAALHEDPAWPPETFPDAIAMKRDYDQRYEAGEFDEVVANLDLNSIVAEAGRLAASSYDGIFPPRIFS